MSGEMLHDRDEYWKDALRDYKEAERQRKLIDEDDSDSIHGLLQVSSSSSSSEDERGEEETVMGEVKGIQSSQEQTSGKDKEETAKVLHGKDRRMSIMLRGAKEVSFELPDINKKRRHSLGTGKLKSITQKEIY